jgi:hypothetical protein
MTLDEFATRMGWAFGHARAVLDAMVADGLAVELDGRYWLAPALEKYRMAFRDLRFIGDDGELAA